MKVYNFAKGKFFCYKFTSILVGAAVIIWICLLVPEVTGTPIPDVVFITILLVYSFLVWVWISAHVESSIRVDKQAHTVVFQKILRVKTKTRLLLLSEKQITLCAPARGLLRRNDLICRGAVSIKKTLQYGQKPPKTTSQQKSACKIPLFFANSKELKITLRQILESSG